MRVYMINRYYERRKRIVEYLGGECVNCKSTEKLEIDHKSEKNFNVAQIWSCKWDKVVKEISLCQLLCYSCHKDKHRTKEHGTLSMYRYCKCEECRSAATKYVRNYRKKLRNKEL